MSSTTSNSKSAYTTVYEQVVDHIVSMQSRVMLEHKQLADQCCVEIHRKDLLSLSNKDFAVNLYCKILDRPPRPADVASMVSRLKVGATTKNKEIDRVLASAEYINKGVSVSVVPQ
jgi:hypothetical protein